jgi:hypothetical protein
MAPAEGTESKTDEVPLTLRVGVLVLLDVDALEAPP